MIPLDFTQYVIGGATKAVPGNSSIISKVVTDASEEIFFSGLFDPLSSATFDRLEAHCQESAVSIAQTQPVEYCGTAADDATVGTVAWTNPTDAQGNTPATSADASIPQSSISHYLKCTNFGFSVPSAATITGITVTAYQSTGGTNQPCDSTIKLVQAGTISGNNLADSNNWSAAGAEKSWGGATELWGLSLSSSDIENSGFGVAISATWPVAGTGVFEIFYVKITVHYTVPVTREWAMRALVQAEPEYCGTAADDATVGTVAWTNPTDAQGNTDATTTAALDSAEESHYLKCTNFGFSIPATADVIGIKVDADTTGSSAEIFDGTVKLVVGGSIVGDNQESAVSWSGGLRSWGADNSLWGNTITAANVNASTFGVALSAESTADTKTAAVKSVAVTVWYRANETLFSETLTLTAGTTITAIKIFTDIFSGGDFVNPKAPLELLYLLSINGTTTATITVAPTGCLFSAIGRYDE